MRSALLALIWCAAVAYGGRAEAQYAGTWNAGPTRIRVDVASWGRDCGPRPRSSTVPAAGQVRITEAGDHLVVHGRSRRRTDGCWSENRLVRRVSSSHQGGTWRVTCRTPRDDPRSETGTYTLRAANENRLEFRDVSRYDWELNESRCVGTITATQVFTRVGAATTTQPTEPEPEPRTPRCTAGAPTRLQVRPAEAEIEPAGSIRFRAAVLDAEGCPVRGRTIRWELRRPSGVGGELRNGTFTAAESAAEAEGEFGIVASSGGLRAEATVVVRTPDLSDLIARRTAGGLVQAQEEDDDAFWESASGVSARAAEPEESTGWLWPLVGAGAALLLILVVVIALIVRRRGAASLPDEPVRRVRDSFPAPAPPIEAAAEGAPMAISGAHAGPAMRACPVCREEYTNPDVTFCPVDGSALVDPESVPHTGQPLICPTCRRGYPPATKTCPDDGEGLIAYALFIEQHKSQEKGGGLAKICPKCGDRYARQVTFCGKDGSELVLVN